MNTTKQLGNLLTEDLTLLQTTVGLKPTETRQYTEPELKVLIKELKRYATAKQEIIKSEIINEWLLTFQEMNISPQELVMRIKIAKNKKRYGNQTTLADFMDLDADYWREYAEYYKPKAIPVSHRIEEPTLTIAELKKKYPEQSKNLNI